MCVNFNFTISGMLDTHNSINWHPRQIIMNYIHINYNFEHRIGCFIETEYIV